MTSPLPPIPDEAVEAVLRHAGINESATDGEGQWMREDLQAAWPHLYAAALRHAAARVRALRPSPNTPLTFEGGTRRAARELNRMADERAPDPFDIEAVHLRRADGSCVISLNGQGHLPCNLSEHRTRGGVPVTLPPIPHWSTLPMWNASKAFMDTEPPDPVRALWNAVEVLRPHLYAAALRHAADNIQPLGAGLTNTELAIADRLRRMADEAVSPGQPEPGTYRDSDGGQLVVPAPDQPEGERRG